MKVLITGSAGHLGDALVNTLRDHGHTTVGVDIHASPETDVIGSIADPSVVEACMPGVDAILHTATLHKPHIETHSRQAFVDTNVSGTLNLLEAAVAHKVGAFVFTSTTSIYGDSLVPPAGAPAAWITEETPLAPKNIYGVTKAAAEDLCQLFHRNQKLPCLILRTSRFFPEADDDGGKRAAFDDNNLKVVELLYRRVDVHDVVTAHLAALDRASVLGFDKFIISATSPFERGDLARLRGQASGVVLEKFPNYGAAFAACGWTMLEEIDRVYVNDHARARLGWRPEYDFARAVEASAQGLNWRSPLAQRIRVKGYHKGRGLQGIYPFLG